MGRVANRIAEVVLGQRGFLFPWAPVCLAVGIGIYFSLTREPPLAELAIAGALALSGFALQTRMNAIWGPFLAVFSLMFCGYALAGVRAHWVAGPVLDFRYYGAIEGRIVGIDRSASDAVRLTLDRVVLERTDPDDTPLRVRVSLHGTQAGPPLLPGATVMSTGHLAAPGGAVEPGGFDFRRHAWFLRLGAVGYTRNPVMLLEPPGRGQWVFKARRWLSGRVQAALPDEAGAFAAAVMTGDRSAMSRDTLQALRDTNLAHLLAISGLHMGLLAGFVFGALRLGLLAVPVLRHRIPIKPVAAGGALLAAFFYLLLSGGSVATERAFVMAAVALTAVMLHRRALSLRAVALAALIVLVLQPEALLSPGFQMSFAATTALVAVFEWFSVVQRGRDWPRWVRPVISLVLSSAVAGAATAPVGMAHFNQVAHYGLVANLVSVPVMGLIVMPMAVLAALLLPFGLEGLALSVMGLGLDWILWVASSVAGWPGAVRPILSPGPAVLPLLAFGGLILCLWRGRGRWIGLAPAAVACALWVEAERPPVLISDSGTLVGVMTPQGRALSRPKGSGFVARVWLENDGAGLNQPQAASLWPPGDGARIQRMPLSGFELVHLQGKRAARGFSECRKDQIIVSSAAISLNGRCRVFDPTSLKFSGAVALWIGEYGLTVTSNRALAGSRLWLGRRDIPARRVAQGSGVKAAN